MADGAVLSAKLLPFVLHVFRFAAEPMSQVTVFISLILDIKGMSNLFPSVPCFLHKVEKQVFLLTCPIPIEVIGVEFSATEVKTGLHRMVR